MKTLIGGWHKRSEECELKIIVLDDRTELQIEDVSYSIVRNNDTDEIITLGGTISIKTEEITNQDALVNSLIDIEMILPAEIRKIQKAQFLQGETCEEDDGIVELHFISNKMEILEFNRTSHQHTEEELIDGMLS